MKFDMHTGSLCIDVQTNQQVFCYKRAARAAQSSVAQERIWQY